MAMGQDQASGPHKYSNYQTIKTTKTKPKMKFIIAIIAAVVAMAMGQDQASGPQADADATNNKHFIGYGYGGYPLLGAGYHYPYYGYGSAYYGYGGYRPCHGYGCILRNKKN